MYIWMYCLNGHCFAGRYWEDFLEFYKIVAKGLCKRGRLITFCHFLPFEFQFIRNFLKWVEIFATEKRKPITALTKDNMEFRCSYKLTNMSLEKFTHQSKRCTHKKQSGEEYDYTVKRYPWTPLDGKHLYYCLCDVLGLWESLTELIEEEIDITYLPLTSTGYVRRDCRTAMLANSENRALIKELALDEYLYVLLRTARRGGDTHADITITGQWLEKVDSWDLQSAYPYVMMTRKYPMSRFQEVSREKFLHEAEKPLEKRTLASVLIVYFDDIKLKDIHRRPYIPVAKCTSKEGFVNDNGRILKAAHLSMVITDIDYDIIVDSYTFEVCTIEHVFSAEYGYLPQELRETILEYFMKKTTLKGVDDYLYMKSKNKLNAIFGMMLTDMCHSVIELQNNDIEEPWVETLPNIEDALKRYYNSKGTFLAYQWGVWVTAHCRYLLHEPVKGDNRMFDAYNDTDSHKMIEGYDRSVFETINERVHEMADSYSVPPYVDYKGKRYYMGEWEFESQYPYFKTLGSKKYIVVDGDKCEVTVSGLNKDKSARFLERKGFDLFKTGTVFPPKDKDGNPVSGRTASVFNDVDKVFYEHIDGHTFLSGSSLSVNDVSYTLGVTPEYGELIEQVNLHGKKVL